MIFESYDQVPARKKRIANGLEARPEILAQKSKEIQDMVNQILELKRKKQDEIQSIE
jgi:hypothetical protein